MTDNKTLSVLNFEHFIVRKLIRHQKSKDSISTPVIKIGIIAIAFGLAMMIITTSTGVGLQDKIKEKLVAFNGHIQLKSYDSNASNVSVNPIKLIDSTLIALKNIKSIKHIASTAIKGGLIRTETAFEGVLVKGVDSTYYWSTISDYLIDGKLPKVQGKQASKEILISKYLSNRLKLDIGGKLQVLFIKKQNEIPNQRFFIVSGIYNSGFHEFDSNYVFIDMRHIQRINKWESDKVGSIELFIDNIDDIFEVNQEVYKNTPSDIDTEIVIKKYDAIMEWLNLMDYNIYIIIAIMIIIGGVNMVTVMLVLVLERTSMIGILKAFGASNWNIRKIFLYQSTYLISLGLFWGNLFGLGLIFVQKITGFITLDPNTYYVTEAPVSIYISHILGLNIGTLILCVIMLVAPSYIVTKIKPIKAIRFE